MGNFFWSIVIENLKNDLNQDRPGRSWVANALTLGRLVLVIPLIWFYYQSEWFSLWALGIASLMIVTDILDGFVARRFSITSNLGRELDILVDKQVILIFLVLLLRYDDRVLLPMLLIFIRETTMFMLRSQTQLVGVLIRPNILSKGKAALQWLAIGLILLSSIQNGIGGLGIALLYISVLVSYLEMIRIAMVWKSRV